MVSFGFIFGIQKIRWLFFLHFFSWVVDCRRFFGCSPGMPGCGITPKWIAGSAELAFGRRNACLEPQMRSVGRGGGGQYV